MKIFRLIVFLNSLLLTPYLWAQEFSKNDQYKQALQNAKLALEAGQYSQAVVFYREAQKINPASLLPKYKIEDIRTIYIEKEMKLHPQLVNKVSTKESRKKKTSKNKEVETSEAIIRETATRKMNEEADKVEVELKKLKADAVLIIEDPIDLDTSGLHVKTIVTDREIGVEPIERINNPQLTVDKGSTTVVEQKLEKRELPNENINHSDVSPEKTTSTVKTTKQQAVYQPVQSEKSPISDEDKKNWIDQETKRLATVYPNRKTVEEIDQPGKHITRVIMNIDHQIIIYLKVQHAWGAVFFFTDEIGQELKSINEQYFNLMTNLETYGN